MSDATPPSPFLYVATPCYGGNLNLNYVQSLLALKDACQARGIGLHVELTGGDALIPRARSCLAAAFLAHPKATHLLFIDADIGFAAEQVFRLLDVDKDLIGGVYPVKRIDWDKVRTAAKADAPDLMAASLGYVVRFLPTPDSSVDVNAGLARVAYVGTGFMMIRRAALARLCAAHPELRADMRDMAGSIVPEAVMVFETMIEPETGHYLSEDYAFCRRWRDLGGEIWADVETRMNHVGHAVYSGSLMQALRPG